MAVNDYFRLTRRCANQRPFIELNDGSCFQNLQIVFDDNLPNSNEISKQIGSSLQVKGNLVETQAKQP